MAGIVVLAFFGLGNDQAGVALVGLASGAAGAIGGGWRRGANLSGPTCRLLGFGVPDGGGENPGG